MICCQEKFRISLNFGKSGKTLRFFVLIINGLRNFQTAVCKCVVETLQSAVSGCKTSGCGEFARRIVFSVNAAVVVVARNIVGHCRSVAKHCILTERITDNASVKSSEGVVTCNNCKCAIFNLLKNIIFTVGLMNLYHAVFPIDGGYVDFGLKTFVSKRKIVTFVGLRLHTEVEIARIVPSANVHKFRSIRHYAREIIHLVVTVEKVAFFCHKRIVEVTGIVPNLIFFVNPHVAHLHRQEILYNRLPHTTFVNIAVDFENHRLAVFVNNLVKSGLFDGRKIKGQVIISQIFTPHNRMLSKNRHFTIGSDFQEFSLGDRIVATIGFDNCPFGLVRKIADLRSLHHRGVEPIFFGVRSNFPTQHLASFSGRQLAAQHKPAVVVIHTSVVKFQLCIALNGDFFERVVGTNHKPLALGVGFRHNVVGNERRISRAEKFLQIHR